MRRRPAACLDHVPTIPSEPSPNHECFVGDEVGGVGGRCVRALRRPRAHGGCESGGCSCRRCAVRAMCPRASLGTSSVPTADTLEDDVLVDGVRLACGATRASDSIADPVAGHFAIDARLALCGALGPETSMGCRVLPLAEAAPAFGHRRAERDRCGASAGELAREFVQHLVSESSTEPEAQSATLLVIRLRRLERQRQLRGRMRRRRAR